VCKHLWRMEPRPDRIRERTYGPTRQLILGIRLGLILLALVMGLQVIIAIAQNRVSVVGGVASFVGVYGITYLLFARVLLRPRIVVGDDGVTVVNFVGKARRAEWQDIGAFSVGAGYFGISIHLKNGGVLIANAVRRSNLMSWLRRPTRADHVVAELNGELARRS
jgi:Bacterial PH domain